MDISFPAPDPDVAKIARKNLIFLVEPDQVGRRLDHFVADRTGLAPDKTQALIDFGSVWVNGHVCRQWSRPLNSAERVTVQAPDYGPVKFYEVNPLRVLFEDDWLLAYDKEAGLPCQQTPYDGYNHLFGALQRYRSGYLALHHRLDAPTSGVMVFAKHQSINPGLSRLFQQGNIEKRYLAVVLGRPPEEAWEVSRPIAKQKGSYFCPPDGLGKPAITHFTLKAQGAKTALVEARPLTGRTHQIRLHLTFSGLPIVGDTAYQGPPARRLMLHAATLAFIHPKTGRSLLIEASAPPGFRPIDLW